MSCRFGGLLFGKYAKYTHAVCRIVHILHILIHIKRKKNVPKCSWRKTAMAHELCCWNMFVIVCVSLAYQRNSPPHSLCIEKIWKLCIVSSVDYHLNMNTQNIWTPLFPPKSLTHEIESDDRPHRIAFAKGKQPKWDSIQADAYEPDESNKIIGKHIEQAKNHITTIITNTHTHTQLPERVKKKDAWNELRNIASNAYHNSKLNASILELMTLHVL